jgi:hypothetical protein
MNMDRDIVRHAAELKNALASHKYEMTPQGIYFSEARAFGSGEYVIDTNGENVERVKNIITIEGFNHMLDVALRGQLAAAGWYIALFSGAYTPVDTLTAATFAAAASEIVSNTQGYAETNRQAWTPTDPAANGILSNVDDDEDNKAVFNIRTATSLVIRGAALLSDSTKGGTTGVLLSASRFTNDRTHYNNDVFNIGYRVRLRPE